MICVMKMEKPVVEGGFPLRKEFLQFGSPEMGKEEIDSVIETLKSGWLTTGPKALEFEKNFAEFTGAKHAIGVNSCTSALLLSIIASGTKQGEEIITTPFTFAATANMIVRSNAKPIFADIDRESFNISPGEIEKKCGEKTKAIIPVHYAGLPCDMQEIKKIASEKNLAVIEDAAHATGSEYKGKRIGSESDFACFSFYPTKNLPMPEGGAVTTNSEEKAKKLSVLRMHGMDRNAWDRNTAKGFKFYGIVEAGFKANMSDVQAAIGLVQLKKMDEINSKREEIAMIYEKELKETDGIILQKRKSDRKQAWHFYPILLELEKLRIGRNEFIAALHAENIGATLNYNALHLEPYYKKAFGFKGGEFPNAEFVSAREISLPVYPRMKKEDAIDACSAVRKLLEYYRK